jgi:hypothetical protein
MEHPDLLRNFMRDEGARDTSGRDSGLSELDAMSPRKSQDMAGDEIPEKSWVYRFAKRNWFFGFGAYG